MNHKTIKKLANKIATKHQTRNPETLASALGLKIIRANLGTVYGTFTSFYRQKLILLNETLPETITPYVIAHEIGHSIMHKGTGAHCMNDNSLLMIGGIEREANQFAVELLLPDELIAEHPDIGIYNLCTLVGIPENLADLKK